MVEERAAKIGRWVTMLGAVILPGLVSVAQAAPVDRSYVRLERSLRSYIGRGEQARYVARFVDLNGDGRREAVVYLSGPAFCGSGGCSALVLTPTTSGFRRVMTASVSQLPIRVLPERTHGWHDIAISVSGGGMVPHEARMRYNGRRYPGNPTVAPSIAAKTRRSPPLISESDPPRPVPTR